MALLTVLIYLNKKQYKLVQCTGFEQTYEDSNLSKVNTTFEMFIRNYTICAVLASYVNVSSQ